MSKIKQFVRIKKCTKNAKSVRMQAMKISLQTIAKAAMLSAAIILPPKSHAKLPELSETENPLIAMFVVNGKPEKSFITRHMEKMRGGFSQFLIYPRTGCEYSYLTDEWFDFVKFLVSEGKRLGYTSVWLYDEFNWPSGTANKQTMKINPDFALRQLSAIKGDDGKITFKTLRNRQMPDLLNEAPVDCFVSLTHEAYYKMFKDDFGGLIKGFFTDEPSIGYFVKDPKFSATIPYYDGLEDDYRALTGGDLRQDIACGIRTNSKPYAAPLSKILGERFRKCYTEKIAEWCAKHNVYATGHMLSEHTAYESARANGYILEPLSALTLPAVDEIRTQENFAQFEWLTFGTGEYAAAKNGNGAMAELFALGPCDMPISQMRRQIWTAAAFGVNRYLLAISQTDLRVKVSDDPHHQDAFTGWLNSVSPSQPWFEKFSELAPEAKKAARFAMKKRDTLVSVVYPYGENNVNDALLALNQNQLSWKLISEKDKPDTKFVLRLKNGLPVGSRSVIQLAQSFAKRSPDRPVVLENGSLAENVLVRPYADGSIVAINFTDDTRNLVLSKNGKKYPFTMYPKGVIALEAGEIPQPEGEKIAPNPDAKWRVEIQNDNSLRPIFKNSAFKFELEKTMLLTFVGRTFGGAPAVQLDGRALQFDAPYDGIIAGLAPLYMQTKVRLEKGEHELKIANGAIDYAYLPSVLICGKFATQGSVLKPYADDGRWLDGYAGKLEQTAQIKIPENAKKIFFTPDAMACELFADGRSLGTRLYAPFSWDIPESLAGKTAQIKLVRYTSLARIFGKLENISQKPKGWSAKTFSEFFPKNSRQLQPFADCYFTK